MSEKSNKIELLKDNFILEKEQATKNIIFKEEANKAIISGIIDEDFKYSHEYMRERFYKTKIRVQRLSKEEDFVPVIISEVLLRKLNKSLKGKWAEITGDFRSNRKLGKDGRMHLELFLFVTSINVYEDNEENISKNLIYLDGYIGKTPIYRQTPKGSEITDIILVVNRKYNKCSYIPCITWRRNAQLAKLLEAGDRIELYGRIQSREYLKRISKNTRQLRQAYEISISKFRVK